MHNEDWMFRTLKWKVRNILDGGLGRWEGKHCHEKAFSLDVLRGMHWLIDNVSRFRVA